MWSRHSSLTGRDAPEDIVRGLDAGADDYLTKPFSLDVLLARIRARTRPSAVGRQARLRFADLAVDFENRTASRGGHILRLTRTEFSILECLVRAAGRVVSRERLLDAVGATVTSALTTSRCSSGFCARRWICPAAPA